MYFLFLTNFNLYQELSPAERVISRFNPSEQSEDPVAVLNLQIALNEKWYKWKDGKKLKRDWGFWPNTIYAYNKATKDIKAKIWKANRPNNEEKKIKKSTAEHVLECPENRDAFSDAERIICNFDVETDSLDKLSVIILQLALNEKMWVILDINWNWSETKSTYYKAMKTEMWQANTSNSYDKEYAQEQSNFSILEEHNC